MAQYVDNDFPPVDQRRKAPKDVSIDSVQYWKCGTYYGNKNNISAVNYSGAYTCESHDRRELTADGWTTLLSNDYSPIDKRPDNVRLLPFVNEQTLISTIQNLYVNLTSEIDDRKKSRLYHGITSDVTYPSADISVGDSIDAKFFNDFRTALQKLDEYDTAKFDVPELSAGNFVKAQDMNIFISKANELFKDCICYSDCSEYAVCYCYGNCNYY